ncbi:MAG TPA: hypothetical protein VEK15_26260 [Vicinamibacteria bacterium]|nr:hypothetical protein [Vicinamibacteria bacterium]
MEGDRRVEVDIANDSQSVTRTVHRVLGEEKSISPDEVQLLANGWVRLRRGETSLYISPHAVDSILVEGGELVIS